MRRREILRFTPFILAVLQGCAAFPQIVRHADPLTPAQHVQLGASYEAEGLKEDARRQYDAALREERENVPALVARGNLAFEGGDLKKAEACYRRALRGDPDDAGANNNLAMVFLSRGKKLSEAERLARKALDRGGPLRPYVLDTLASLYIRQGRREEALKALDEADASAPAGAGALRARLAETRKELRNGK